MCGTLTLGGQPPRRGPGRIAEPRLVVLVAPLEQDLHADAHAEHRACRRRRTRGSAPRTRLRAAPRMHAPKCPTPGITQRVGAAERRRARSATRTSAPTCASARETEWRLPAPVVEDGDRRGHQLTAFPSCEGTPPRPVRRARVAERLRERLERRLADVVRRAPGPQVGVDRELGRSARTRGRSPRAARCRTPPIVSAGTGDLVDDERAARRGRARPRPPPRRAARRSRRTGARPPCRRAPRAAPARARCRTSSTVWCPSTSRSPLQRHRQVEPGVLAELLQHVVEERHARVGARACPTRRASSSTRDVGLLRRARDASRCGSSGEHLLERVEEQVGLVLGAGGDAQRVRHDRASGRGPARRGRAAPATPSPASARRHEQHEVRVATGTRSTPRHRAQLARGSGRAATRIASSIAVASSRVAERRDAGRLRERRQVVGQPHPLQVVDDLGRRRARSRSARRPARTPSRTSASIDDVRVRRRRAPAPTRAAELDVGLVDDHEARRQRLGERGDRRQRLGVAGRVVRRADEHDVGAGVDRRRDLRRRRARSRRPSASVLDLGLRQPAQARVQQVGRLEAPPRAGRGRRRPAAAGSGSRSSRSPPTMPSTGCTDARGELLAQPRHLRRRGSGSAAGRGSPRPAPRRTPRAAGAGTRSCSAARRTSSCGET